MEKFSDVNFEKSTKEISQIQQMLQNTLIEMRGIAAGFSLPQLVDFVWVRQLLELFAVTSA